MSVLRPLLQPKPAPRRHMEDRLSLWLADLSQGRLEGEARRQRERSICDALAAAGGLTTLSPQQWELLPPSLRDRIRRDAKRLRNRRRRKRRRQARERGAAARDNYSVRDRSSSAGTAEEEPPNADEDPSATQAQTPPDNTSQTPIRHLDYLLESLAASSTAPAADPYAQAVALDEIAVIMEESATSGQGTLRAPGDIFDPNQWARLSPKAQELVLLAGRRLRARRRRERKRKARQGTRQSSSEPPAAESFSPPRPSRAPSPPRPSRAASSRRRRHH